MREAGFRRESWSRFEDKPSGGRGDYWSTGSSRSSSSKYDNFGSGGDSQPRNKGYDSGSTYYGSGGISNFGKGGSSSYGYGSGGSSQMSYDGSSRSFNDDRPPRNFSERGSRNFNDSFDDNHSQRNFDSGPSYNFNNDGPGGPSNFGSGAMRGSSNFGPNGPSNYGPGGSSNYGPGRSSNFVPDGSGGPSNFGTDGPNGPSNYCPNGPSNFGPGGPSNFGGGSGPMQSGNDMGPPRGGNRLGNSNFGGGPGGSDLYSSIQNLSQTDIASKIISAVLNSTNMMGNMGNQSQDPSFDQEKMGGGFSNRISFLRSDSGPRSFGSSRGSGGGGGFSRYARGGRGIVRGGYSGSSRSGFDRNRLGLKSIRSQKRPLRDSSPKDSSRYKKRKSESQERRKSPEKDKDDNEAEKKSSDKNESPSKKEDTKEEGSPTKEGKETSDKDDIPLAALYCHMCKHGNFTSVKTYLYHLDGIKHKKVAMAFNAKNESSLEYLRKNAKLANLRFGGKEALVVPSKCSICTAVIKESFGRHKKLFEHRLVKKFMNPKCCGRYFKSRYDMNEHRLSLPHLKKVYEKGQSENPIIDEVLKGKGEDHTFEEMIQLLKSRNPSIKTPLTLNNMPPYDGNCALGMELLEPVNAAMCRACRVLIPSRIQSFDMHLSSMDHYNAISQYLRDQAAELRKEKRYKVGESSDNASGSGSKSEKIRREEEDRSSGDDDSDEDNDVGSSPTKAVGPGDDDDDEEDEDEDEDEDRVNQHQEEFEAEVMAERASDTERDHEGKEEAEESEEVQTTKSETEGKDDELPFIDETDHIVIEEIGEDLNCKDDED